MIAKTEHEIIQNWPKEWNKPLVSIRCLAYNHEAFIAEALDSFLSQKTNFPFEIVVHDDVSTDKTADIIREYECKYPQIIKPIYEIENQFSKKDGSLARIVDSACKGKYIAYCEGDDFWVNPLKLQKQVDILEENPKVSLVHTGFITVDEKGNEIYRSRFIEYQNESKKEEGLKSLFKGNHIMTLTIMIRREIINTPLYLQYPHKWDYTIFFAAAFLGDIKYIPQNMGAYRKVFTSVTQAHSNKLHNELYKVYKFYAEKFLISHQKKLNIFDSISCLYRILTNVIIHKDMKFLFEIVKNKPTRFFFLPISFVNACYLRLKVFTKHFNK